MHRADSTHGVVKLLVSVVIRRASPDLELVTVGRRAAGNVETLGVAEDFDAPPREGPLLGRGAGAGLDRDDGAVRVRGSRQEAVADTRRRVRDTAGHGTGRRGQLRTADRATGLPAPRIGAALAPNLNSASASFEQQVFLLLGTFNSSEWQDDGGLDKGEVVRV